MKVILNDLKNALLALSTNISNSTIGVIPECVKLTIKGDYMYLLSSDLQNFITTKINGSNGSKSSVSVICRFNILYNIINELNTISDICEIKLSDVGVCISCANGVYNIGATVVDFPPIPVKRYEFNDNNKYPAPTFIKYLKSCIPTVSNDDLRENLYCVYLDSKTGNIVSTNIFALTYIGTDFNFETSMGIPFKIANILSKITDIENIYIKIYSGVCVVKAGDIIYQFTPTTSPFPDYVQILPDSYNSSVLGVNKPGFLKQVKSGKNYNPYQCQLKFNNESVNVTFDNEDEGLFANVALEVNEIDCEDSNVFLNTTMLQNILNISQESECNIKLSPNKGKMILIEQGVVNTILMPLNI